MMEIEGQSVIRTSRYCDEIRNDILFWKMWT